MNWNLPYGTVVPPATGAVDHVSPLSDMTVATPRSCDGAPSPATAAVSAMTRIDRARLFVRGKHHELLRSIDKKQRL